MKRKQVGRPSKHPLEFRIAVVEQIAQGMSYREAQKRYGVSHGSIGLWMKKYSKQTLHQMKAPSNECQLSAAARDLTFESENRALKQELAELYMQVQMLKKAQAFAEQAKRDASSIVTSESSAPFKGAAR